MLKFISIYGFCAITPLCFAAGSLSNAQFAVQANIEKGCTLSSVSQDLSFSPVPALSQNKVSASIINHSQNWNIRCTAELPVKIELDGGENYADIRRMRHVSSNDFIPYRLYSDQSYSHEYLNGQHVSVTVDSTKQLLSFAIYAIADLNNNLQSRPSGIYNDSVAITISW